jgi:hypothetical protein
MTLTVDLDKEEIRALLRLLHDQPVGTYYPDTDQPQRTPRWDEIYSKISVAAAVASHKETHG